MMMTMTMTTMTGSATRSGGMTMTDDLVKRLDDLDTILETEFDTQLSVQRNPYGATKAIEDALYLLRDQAARLEALTAERDEYRRLATITELVARECKIQEARAEKAEADNARLLKALEPFASALKGNWSHQPDGTKILCGTSEFDLRLNLTLGDFRRAAAALNTGKEVMPFVPIDPANQPDIGPGDQGAVAGAALPTVDKLAQIIRTVDGNHSLGAGELAERILSALAQKGASHD